MKKLLRLFKKIITAFKVSKINTDIYMRSSNSMFISKYNPHKRSNYK